MQAYMRNKLNGEIKMVEHDSPEFVGLTEERDGDGFPVWEQTGRHHAAAVEERRENDALTDEDLGKENEPQGAVVYDKSNLVEVSVSDLDLTPGEVESGLTPDSKADQLSDQFGISRSGFASDAPADHSAKAKKEVAKRRGGKKAGDGRSGSPSKDDGGRAGSSGGKTAKETVGNASSGSQTGS